jgi:regulator of replication initiation timing
MGTKLLIGLLVSLGAGGALVRHFVVSQSAPAALAEEVRPSSVVAAAPVPQAPTPANRESPPVTVAPASPLPPPVAPAPNLVDWSGVDPAEVARLTDEVKALKARAAQLEQQLAAVTSSSEENARILPELEALRAQVANDAAQRQAARQKTEQHAADVDQAIAGLIAIDAQLAVGNLQVQGAIARAEPLLKAQARADLAALRHALENSDIANARQALQQAIADAQLSR